MSAGMTPLTVRDLGRALHGLHEPDAPVIAWTPDGQELVPVVIDTGQECIPALSWDDRREVYVLHMIGSGTSF